MLYIIIIWEASSAIIKATVVKAAIAKAAVTAAVALRAILDGRAAVLWRSPVSAWGALLHGIYCIGACCRMALSSQRRAAVPACMQHQPGVAGQEPHED